MQAVSNLLHLCNSSIFASLRGQTRLPNSRLAAAALVQITCELDVGVVGRWGTRTRQLAYSQPLTLPSRHADLYLLYIYRIHVVCSQSRLGLIYLDIQVVQCVYVHILTEILTCTLNLEPRPPLHRHQPHRVMTSPQWNGIKRSLLYCARAPADVESGDRGRIGAIASAQRPEEIPDYPEI